MKNKFRARKTFVHIDESVIRRMTIIHERFWVIPFQFSRQFYCNRRGCCPEMEGARIKILIVENVKFLMESIASKCDSQQRKQKSSVVVQKFKGAV